MFLLGRGGLLATCATCAYLKILSVGNERETSCDVACPPQYPASQSAAPGQVDWTSSVVVFEVRAEHEAPFVPNKRRLVSGSGRAASLSLPQTRAYDGRRSSRDPRRQECLAQ
ncbi:hypothetical protein SFRURICE_015210 [Spodoptera frugiperda]|nr:hypothetical protein SFRURICE_015210 [Spodoptera frugiperda]